MNGEFTNINGVDGWKAKLQELLKAAEAAAGDVGQIVAVSERLVGFITHSTPDDSPAIQEMDNIAAQTRNELIKGTVEERLAGITARTNELAGLDKKIRAIAAESQAKAASIRLEGAQNLVKSLIDTVSSLKTFQGTLTTGTDGELAKNVAQIVTDIQTLSTKVQGIL